MAFRMNPKSPLLMKAMGTASPAKNMNKGYGPAKTSSPAKQKSGGSMTAAEKKKVAVKDAEPVKKANAEKAQVEKAQVEIKELTPKQKALKKLQEANSDNEVANIEKETSKVQKNSTKKRKQAARKKSQAERRTERTRVLEEKTKSRKATRSPAKILGDVLDLPKKALNAITGSSPAKQLKDKAAKKRGGKPSKSPAKLDPMTMMMVMNAVKNKKK